MHWHYRIRKRILDGEPWYDIVEYFPSELRKDSWTRESIAPGGETRGELIRSLEMMLKDAKNYEIFFDEEKD